MPTMTWRRCLGPVWPVAGDGRCETSTTRKPARLSFFVARVKGRPQFIWAIVARPEKPGRCSRHKKSSAWGIESVRRNFFEKRIRKFHQGSQSLRTLLCCMQQSLFYTYNWRRRLPTRPEGQLLGESLWRTRCGWVGRQQISPAQLRMRFLFVPKRDTGSTREARRA